MYRIIFDVGISLIMVSQIIAGSTIQDTPFIQEYHEAYTVGEQKSSNDVRAITVDNNNNVWIATGDGIFLLKKGKSSWVTLLSSENSGPAFDVTVDAKGIVWIAAWNGIYKSGSNGLVKINIIDNPISAICAVGSEIIAMGPDGMWSFKDREWKFQDVPYSKNIRKVVSAKEDGIWIVTGMGLYLHHNNDFKLYQNVGELLTPDLYDAAYTSEGNLWIAGLGGITVHKKGERIGQFTPADGLPSVYVQSVTRGPDNSMWVGTKYGVTRFNGNSWSLRHSRRWLLSDNVRDIAFDSQGSAWIATDKGVSVIKRKMMTLSQKADHFYRICMARHVRDPWIVEKCFLKVPGDTSTWAARDCDNDGQYTSMYLAMESYRYAVTKSAQAKSHAQKAFETLEFFQTVTETKGFVARTVVPPSWERMFDPNKKINEREWANMRVHNPREKMVEERWHLSKDGEWLWKGDTSSDEITGHMYGYLLYHDLVADEKEQSRVRDHVCRIVDYIIDGGFVLKDLDGTHTKWAVWSPEKLNHDPDWRTERGINSVEILSYLKLAYHVSGNARYQREYENLLYNHCYAENVKNAKTVNPSWRTHIDDELLALAYPCLLMYEKDPELRSVFHESFDNWYAAAEDDCSPYFNFIYGSLTGDDPDLECSVFSLRDTPIDLIHWRIDNTIREDIKLVHAPEMESIQTSRLLPPSEGGVTRWDKNPWLAVQGDGGYTESDGVFWLLPYWMGRYYGFIQAP